MAICYLAIQICKPLTLLSQKKHYKYNCFYIRSIHIIGTLACVWPHNLYMYLMLKLLISYFELKVIITGITNPQLHSATRVNSLSIYKPCVYVHIIKHSTHSCK